MAWAIGAKVVPFCLGFGRNKSSRSIRGISYTLAKIVFINRNCLSRINFVASATTI